MPKEIKIKMGFLESYVPQIKSGTYTINVGITIDSPNQNLNIQQKFKVNGPRFALSPSDIHSVFPPSNHHGNFEQCLPHIILNRATIPWERKMCHSEKTPWMALLLFYENEILETKNLKIKDLNENEYEIPDLNLNESEKEESCVAIEVSLRLFRELLPSEKELQILAHVRSVDNQEKETNSPDNNRFFAVSVGNRLPDSTQTGKKNTVHLVSLEGFKLKTFWNDSNNNSSDPEKRIRLISLASWSFYSIKGERHFKEIAEKLDAKTIGLKVEKNVEEKEEQKIVKEALELGYVALNHSTRLGDKTVSWYRGPIIPHHPIDESLVKGEDDPQICADSALRFDPNTGLFDVSYAAAWQLGRLLALQNRHFAASIHNWARKSDLEERVESNKDAFAKMLPIMNYGIDIKSSESIEKEFAKYILGKLQRK
jgi:hypothetical protein